MARDSKQDHALPDAGAEQPKAALAVLDRPGFQLGFAVLGAVAIPLLLAALIVILPGVDIPTARTWFFEHDAVQVYFQFVVFGMLSMLFVIFRRDDLAQYGIRREGLVSGSLLALLLVVIHWTRIYLQYGEWLPHPSLEVSFSLPVKLFYVLFGTFSYGLLELFFLVWMIVKVDQITDSAKRVWSPGLLIISVLFGLLHILTTGDLSNTLTVTAIYLGLNLIFKYTGNSIGPMLGWTLINAQVWAYLELLWKGA